MQEVQRQVPAAVFFNEVYTLEKVKAFFVRVHINKSKQVSRSGINMQLFCCGSDIGALCNYGTLLVAKSSVDKGINYVVV